MTHIYFSQRTGTNPNLKGLPLDEITMLFERVYDQLVDEGYFVEAFGYSCTDAGHVAGLVRDVELEILLSVRKRNLWPIAAHRWEYDEDDLFDLIEFLFQHVSKPIDGFHHSHNGCGMHWETFNREEGRAKFLEKINSVLVQYERPFELSARGEVLTKPEAGFETIFNADTPSNEPKIVERINSAILSYRRHGSTLADRRQAVCDLIGVLEYLRPQVKALLTRADENDLFNIANNFGLRHNNDTQKTNYDASLWLSWMFYYYLATIHVVLRKIEHDGSK